MKRFLAGEFDNVAERLAKVDAGRGYSWPEPIQELSLDDAGRVLARLSRG